MDDREQKIGENEALFRKVNEEVQRVNESFSVLTETMTMICECGDATCIEQMELQPQAYETLRTDPTLFAIRPGHDIPDVEDVVEQNEGYWVVKKHAGGPADRARETHTRP